MLTQKNYVEFAELFRRAFARVENLHEENAILRQMNDFISYFTRDNPKFDRTKFLGAVLPDGWNQFDHLDKRIWKD